MLSGCGLSAAAAAKAFSRLVPPWGAGRAKVARARSSDARSRASSQVPSVPGRTAPRLDVEDVELELANRGGAGW